MVLGNKTSIKNGSDIILSLETDDNNKVISKVEIYDGFVLLWIDIVAPYSFNWLDVPEGTHVVVAISSNSSGAFRSSLKVTVEVITPTRQLPGDPDYRPVVYPNPFNTFFMVRTSEEIFMAWADKNIFFWTCTCRALDSPRGRFACRYLLSQIGVCILQHKDD